MAPHTKTSTDLRCAAAGHAVTAVTVNLAPIDGVGVRGAERPTRLLNTAVMQLERWQQNTRSAACSSCCSRRRPQRQPRSKTYAVTAHGSRARPTAAGPSESPPQSSRQAWALTPPPFEPNPGRRLVTSPPPSNSSRRRGRAWADRPAGLSSAMDSTAPAQSKRRAGTRVQRANSPRLRRVQHAAEPRTRAVNAPPPPAARAGRATRHPASAALQGARSSFEPMPPSVAGPHPGPSLARSPPPSSSSRHRTRACFRQAGWSELRRGKASHAGAAAEARWDKGAAGKPPKALSGPACSRAMSSRRQHIAAASSARQSCGGTSHRRRAPKFRLRLRLRADAAADCSAKTRQAFVTSPSSSSSNRRRSRACTDRPAGPR